MKKILVVDNNIDPPYGCAEIVENLRVHLPALGAAEIFSLRGPDSALPATPAGIDAVVLSGSKTRIAETAPWIEKQMAFIQDLYKMRIPTLGICYGEQLIARTLVGEQCTGISKIYEYGWVEIKKTAVANHSKVFGSLPESFYSFGFHSDEVYSLPGDRFAVMAQNENCAVQAFDVLGAPMWGVQFHPERSLAEGNAGLDRLMARDPARIILGREKGESVFDSKVASVIFRAFLTQVWLGEGR